MIKIMFLGPFSRYMPEEDKDGFWVIDAAGKSITDVINTTEVVNAKMNYFALINDVQTDKGYILQDGDELNILPLFFAG